VPPLKVAVLGVGLIGGSIGLAARARTHASVTGWDPDSDVRARALALGAIDAAASDIAAAVTGADVVFVAAPVGALVQTVRAALDASDPRTIVTDAGSTKRLVVDEIADTRFIGGHPLAGSELSGVAHAREDLFDGATWFLCPGGSPKERERLSELIAGLGATTVEIDAGAHDRLMATVSQLPHVLANLLVAQAAAAGRDDEAVAAGRDDGMRGAVGPSFRDATRVAGSNSAIWTDIYMSNHDLLIAAIDDLSARLARVRELLANGDELALRCWNEQARAERAVLPGEADPD
jgi:prephenate dehydrogenase